MTKANAKKTTQVARPDHGVKRAVDRAAKRRKVPSFTKLLHDTHGLGVRPER